MRQVFLLLITCFLTTFCYAQTDVSDWMNVQINACLENEQVHGYMENVKYEGILNRNNDKVYLDYSHITEYSDVETDYRKDQPEAVRVPLPAALSENRFLVYYDSIAPLKLDTVMVAGGSEEVLIWNLIPSHTYYYTIEGITAGTIHTTGQMRHLRIDSGFNVRDIGGYMTASGKRLRYGLILRGSEMVGGRRTTFTPEDIAEMRRQGVLAELDLRKSSDFVSGEPQKQSALGEDANYLSLQMVDDSFILRNYHDEYKQAFEFIYDNLSHGRSVYIHCTFGADRTGTMCAVIEAMCGVAIGDIYKDYEVTSFANGTQGGDLHRYYHTINQRLIRMLYIYYPQDVTPTVVSYLQNTCGISKDIIEGLRNMLVDDGTPFVPPFVDDAISAPVLDGNPAAKTVYSLDGTKIPSARQGLNIVRGTDGKFSKYYIK